MRTLRDIAAVALAMLLTACPPDKKQSEDADAIPVPAEPNAPPPAATNPNVAASPHHIPPPGAQPARPLVAPSAH